MIGMISVKPTNLFRYLVQDECSLLIQAEKGEQSDGWGIGYYEQNELRVFKSPNSAYKEKELFRKLSRQISSNIIIAHVRKASNPRGLPKSMLIAIENTQPFYYENYLFVHNGTVYYPDEVLKRLGDYKSLVKGLNDSEIYFAYLIKELKAQRDFVKAIKSVKEGLWHILREIRGQRDTPYSSLNAIFSDGQKLYAITHYLKGKELKSICYKDTPYFRMTYYCDDEKLIVASERTNRDSNWRIMENNDILIAEIHDGRIKYQILKLE